MNKCVANLVAPVQRELWEDEGQESHPTRYAGDSVGSQHPDDCQRNQLPQVSAPVDLPPWHADVRSGAQSQRAAQWCEWLSSARDSYDRSFKLWIPSLTFLFGSPQIFYKDDLNWLKGIGCYAWDTPEILRVKRAGDLQSEVSSTCFPSASPIHFSCT